MTSHLNEKYKEPDVFITEPDYQALAKIAVAAPNMLPGARLLIEELDRAIFAPDNCDIRFAKIGSIVKFQETGTGRIQRVQLCLPREADMDEGRVSVLTPVGAALVGLSADSRFRWIGADGRTRELKVLRVDDPVLVA